MTPVPIQFSFLVSTGWAGISAAEGRPPCRGNPSFKCTVAIQVPERSESQMWSGPASTARRNHWSKQMLPGAGSKDVISVGGDVPPRFARANAQSGSENREPASTLRLTTQASWNWTVLPISCVNRRAKLRGQVTHPRVRDSRGNGALNEHPSAATMGEPTKGGTHPSGQRARERDRERVSSLSSMA